MMCGTASLASAQAAKSGARPAAAPGITATGPVDLQTANCGQFQRALAMANPGKNPSPARQDAAIASQDVLIQGLMWVSGYLSGRSQGKAVIPFDADFISQTVNKLAKICKANGASTRFVDAAAKL